MPEDPEGVKAFSKKYVYPLLEQKSEEGMKMDQMFGRTLADIDIRAFKTGFKACMNLITKCLLDKDFLDHLLKKEAET